MIKNVIMVYDDLRVLIAVADSKNFRLAAEHLGLSQASVTNKLASLEGLYKAPILVANGKRKILTPFGQALVEVARSRLTEFSNALREVEQKFVGNNSMSFRVGCRPEIFSHLLMRLPSRHSYELVPMPGQKVAPAVQAGKIEIGFTSVLPDSHGIIAKKVFRSSVQLVVQKSLLPRDKSSSELWRNSNFLTQSPALLFGPDDRLIKDVCMANAISIEDLKKRVVAESWDVLLRAVESGLGYALLPSYMQASPAIFSGAVPSSICAHHDFYLVMRTAYRDVGPFKEVLRSEWG